ncbi:DUF1444 domain-containing protein [Pradoshia sp.]|uniref:DUF1444 domain-containing protein n=1 Tax=Pradoshia sp. TaxID=2651281 RepID=UPI003F0250FC
MKMTTTKMKNILMEKLSKGARTFSYNREQEELRIEDKETKKGITVALSPLLAKYDQSGDKAIDEIVYYAEESLKVMGKEHALHGNEKKIFPVIRSTSFPEEAKEGVPFVTDEHTAETRIYYAVDLGNTYRLIDEELMEKEKWDKEMIRTIAMFNVRSLPVEAKKDTVRGNDFYFINHNDGYDASRILMDSELRKYKDGMKGSMAVAVPHQDVLIIADIQNSAGYDILAQMNMHFFTNGNVPITALPFLYEDGELEPIFILAKNRPVEDN